MAVASPKGPPTSRPSNLYSMLRNRWLLVVSYTLASTLTAGILVSPPLKQDEFSSTVSMVLPSIRNAKSLTFLKSEFAGYGVASPREMHQVYSALQSQDAFNYMVDKFKLVEHYGLATIESPHTRNKTLEGYYKDNVHIESSRRATLRVTVYDTDPNLASEMANEFVVYANRFLEQQIRREKSLVELEQSIYAMRRLRSVLEDSTSFYLRDQMRMYSFDNLGEVMSASVARDLFSNPKFARSYDKLHSAEMQIRYIESHLAEMTSEFSYRRENLRIYPTLINTPAVGLPAVVPARPNRPLFISLSALASFLVVCAFVWLIDGLLFFREKWAN